MVIRRRHFVISSYRGDGSIAARDLLIQNMQLPHQRGERRLHAARNRLVAFRQDDTRQFTGDDPNLGQMPAKRVDQLRGRCHVRPLPGSTSGTYSPR